MDIEQIRDYCLGKKGVTECFPFDDVNLVFKVGGRMFALLPLDRPDMITLKCDPERAVGLRESYPEYIQPAFHFNKRHWNQVHVTGHLSSAMVKDLIDHSYSLVFSKLPKPVRMELEQ